MKNKIKRNYRLLLIGSSVFLLTFILLFLALGVQEYIKNEYLTLSKEYIKTQKKKHIKDTINLLHDEINSDLTMHYKELRKKLSYMHQKLILEVETTQNKDYSAALTKPEFSNLYTISRLINANSKKREDASRNDITKNIAVVTPINSEISLYTSVNKEHIYNGVKKHIKHFLQTVTFTDPEMYLWIHEVLDFNGGDGYAIEVLHQNLPQKVGTKLSTNTRDIRGAFPYRDELAGINKEQEVYIEYYFKKHSSEDIAHKLSYAKLFEPFNWIIATGIYLDDIDYSISKKSQELLPSYVIAYGILILVSLILASFFVYYLYKKEEQEFLAIRANEQLQFQTKELQDYQQILYSLLELMEKRDTYTAGHTRRVARYSILIAEAMGISDKESNLLYETALLHDIGKVVTPDSVLLKPGSLTDVEYLLIKEHLTSGYELLVGINAFKEHAAIMHDHHEHYDGKGYPRGRKGDEISLLSHILIVADAFDAMTSNRIYHHKKTLEIAIVEIQNLSGQQFSPEVVKFAIPMLEQYGVLSTVNQLPKTNLEQARFAYFFTDSLTGLYNYHYLEFILQKHYEDNEPIRCGYFIDIKNFSQFNNENGWLKGDTKLTEIAGMLKALYPSSLLFRIYGDDFLIVRNKHHDISLEEIQSFKCIQDTILDVRLQHIDFHTVENVEVLSEQIHRFIHEAK